MPLTKEERQKIDASIPKCKCGNNLSKVRQEEGITVCPACDTTDLQKKVAEVKEKYEYDLADRHENIIIDKEDYELLLAVAEQKGG